MLLQAVRLLHDRGYELLRIHPTFYATGHWRCFISSGRWPDDVLHLQYTNGRWWDVLDDGDDRPMTAEQLADRFEASLPRLERARGSDVGYRFWYAALLEHCGAKRLPYLYDDYTSPAKEGRVGITAPKGEGLLGDSFPLPPT